MGKYLISWVLLTVLLVKLVLGQLLLLRDNIRVETVSRGQEEKYLVIYNHQITNYFEAYDLDNELKCRYLAMALNYTTASVQVRNGTNPKLGCRISPLGIKEGIILAKQPGTHTYIRDAGKTFYPALNGLFYVHYKDQVLTKYKAKTFCPATSTSQLPTTRTEMSSHIVSEIASWTSDGVVWIGAGRTTNNSVFYWYDSQLFFFPKNLHNGSITPSPHLTYTSFGQYHTYDTDLSLEVVCSYKIFDFNWE